MRALSGFDSTASQPASEPSYETRIGKKVVVEECVTRLRGYGKDPTREEETTAGKCWCKTCLIQPCWVACATTVFARCETSATYGLKRKSVGTSAGGS